MFRKLVSDLPFSPSLINRVDVCSRRLKNERLIRRLGLLLAVLVVLSQSLALLVPAKATLAASANDIVWGGGNKQELLTAYRQGCDHYFEPRCDIQAIFNAYGINMANLAAAQTEDIYSSESNDYWLTGRVQRSTGDVIQSIPQGFTIQVRTLHGWKNGLSRWWKTLRVETTQGPRWLLTDSGNIVTKQEHAVKTTSGRDTSQLELHQKARNITQQLNDANGTTAQAGDTIEYTLFATNRSSELRKGFVIEEEVEDIMEYADIIDASGAVFSLRPIRRLAWAPVDILPNETIARTILIQIKSPVPASPASTSDPKSYDMRLFSTHGDNITISLPPNPLKTVEQTVQILPTTRGGAGVVTSVALLLLASYFYFRNQLSIKELGVIKKQFGSGQLHE